MKVLNVLLHLIIALMLVQFVLSGDEIIEDVDEVEQPENLDGVSLVKLQEKEQSTLKGFRLPRD